MSTTVTYRGDTIASMGNTGTKTLKTAGKYLDDDITITANVPSGSVNVPTVMIDPDISISVGSDGLITAGVSESASLNPEVTNGYITETDVTVGIVGVAGERISQLPTQAGKTVTPTESVQTAVAAGKYTTGAVKVGAISSTYIGSGVPQKSSSDLTVSGDTVTAPVGYYASAASKSVASMTLPTTTDSSATSGYSLKKTVTRSTSDQYINIPTGYNSAGAYYKVNAVPNMTLPTAASSSATTGYTSKATISRSTSNQYINIPTGYNTAGAYYTISGVPNMTLPTAVASSATSGYTSKATISRSTSDQYINIPTGYNTAGAYYKVSAVPNGTAGTPTATKGTVSNNSITVTPSVTNTTGYITGSTKTGTAVTVSASELVSGTKSITAAGTTDVTNYASASVAQGFVSVNDAFMVPVSITVDPTNGYVTASGSITKTLSADVMTPGYVSSSSNVDVEVDVTVLDEIHLTTQAKMVAVPDNIGDKLAGLTTQYYYTFRAKDLVQGQWSLNVPADTPLTRARTKDFIEVSAGDTVTYTNNSYDSYFQVYGSKTSSTISQNIGWKTDSGGTINITVNGYLTFVTRNHYNTSANVNPALWDGAVTINHVRSHNGVNFTWNGADTCVVSGTCNDVGAVSPMIANSAIPSFLSEGITYCVTCTSTPLQSNVRLRIMFYDSSGTVTNYLYFNQNGFFVVPSGAVNWAVQLHSMPSVSYSPTVTLSNIHIYPVKKIIDAGTYTTGDIYVSAY